MKPNMTDTNLKKHLDVIENVTDGGFLQSIVDQKEHPDEIHTITQKEFENDTYPASWDKVTLIEDMSDEQRVNIMQKGARLLYSEEQLHNTLEFVKSIDDEQYLNETYKNTKERDAKKPEWIQAKKELCLILLGSQNIIPQNSKK